MRRYLPPTPSAPQIYLKGIPLGYPGTKETIKHIQALIRQGVKDFYVRQKAIDILIESGIQPKDYLGEINALFEWVQKSIRYTKDPFQLEVLHSARRILELRAGDCDDMTIVLGALLESVGHPIRIVITGPTPYRPDFFSHIYLEVFYKGNWIPLDATMHFPMGWAPRTFVKRVIPIERRANMLSEDTELHGTVVSTTIPEWLRGLIRAVRQDGIQPRDSRVKALWKLLHQRNLLSRNIWLRSRLQFIWRNGLSRQPRPYTTRRLVRILRQFGILSPIRTLSPSIPIRPLRPVTLQPVNQQPTSSSRPLPQRGTLRPVGRAQVIGSTRGS
jgi:hypothetical protein